MTFKQFITRQRVTILIIGITLFIVSFLVARRFGYESLWGGLFDSLAASSITIVFTALIIDYLGVREEASKTSDAASLAQEEIDSICARVEWQIARLFGLEPNRTERESISNHDEAAEYIQNNNARVQEFLSNLDFTMGHSNLNEATLAKFIERLQQMQSQLEQTLVLYEYALGHDFRVSALSLRRELQTTERLLSFIDFSETLSTENESLIRFSTSAIHETTQAILNR
ncbi:MAG TPA: hypothetical protein VMB52_04085 [Verrucomicrobiae bacterium]|nr:hypothetical protein [Verrucomicrobiae bacterium]